MRHTKILLLIYILCSISFYAAARSDTLATDTAALAKKPLMLSFGLDVNLRRLAGSYDHNYTGEYNIFGSGPGGWEWVNHRTTDNELMKWAKFTEIKLSVMGSTSKNLKFGLGYNFGNISVTIPEPNFDTLNNPGKKINYVEHSMSYAGICAMGEYAYYFNKETNLGPFAYGALDLGFYTGTDDVFGPGLPVFVQGKLGLGYNFKNDQMVKLFVATDQLIYHESTKSQVFQKYETLNINVSALYFGIGFTKMFTIFPD